MSGFESVPVPFVYAGNRRALTDQQLADDPYLRQFVETFAGAFERDDDRQLWLFIDPPLPSKENQE